MQETAGTVTAYVSYSRAVSRMRAECALDRSHSAAPLKPLEECDIEAPLTLAM